MFHIALFEPQVPPNTGNIIRLVANNGCSLHLIEPMAFDLQDKNLRRAGLDYHDLSRVKQHKNYLDFVTTVAGKRLFACTTKGARHHHQINFLPDDVLLFGSETSGLPADILASIITEHQIRIPMMPNNRSLNLSNAVAIISYEAWRQQGFEGGQ